MRKLRAISAGYKGKIRLADRSMAPSSGSPRRLLELISLRSIVSGVSRMAPVSGQAPRLVRRRIRSGGVASALPRRPGARRS